jgi:RNA recognition motif. (a.k.a. RRM, RBD, or RNP domain)
MVRIYVGGLAPTVSEEDLKERFKPFGDVKSSEVVWSKAVEDGRLLPGQGRGFGYVELVPKDEAALHRCLSVVCRAANTNCADPMPSMSFKGSKDPRLARCQHCHWVCLSVCSCLHSTTAASGEAASYA